MDKHPLEHGIGEVVKTYELLDRARLGKDILVRDDQFESEALLDAAREARAKGIRVGLIDTGRFDAAGLERLIREHVRFYTSDEARARPPELARILKACRKARSFASYFQNGPLPEPGPARDATEGAGGKKDTAEEHRPGTSEPVEGTHPGSKPTGAAAHHEGINARHRADSGTPRATPREGTGPSPMGAEPSSGPMTGRALLELVHEGLDFHVSNLVHPRDFAVLEDIADEARFGRAFFAYYHHGPLDADIVPLAARGAWVHVSDRSVRDGRAAELALKIAEACQSGGSRAILYIQEGLPLDVVTRLFDAGAAVLFHTPPSDRASLFRPLEGRAAKRRLPVRAYYLSTTFLL